MTLPCHHLGCTHVVEYRLRTQAGNKDYACPGHAGAWWILVLKGASFDRWDGSAWIPWQFPKP